MSVSQTPLAQTAEPAAVVHTPVSGGLCPAIIGMGVPLARSTVQADVIVLQNLPVPQLESMAQVFAHAPLAWQMPPVCVAPEAAQVVVPLAAPHVAQAAPVPGQ